MNGIVKILLALVLSRAITLGEDLKSRPLEFGAGSSLKIDAGVHVYALAGSVWDFTGATPRGLTGLPPVTGQTGKLVTSTGASANRQSISESAPTGSVGDLSSKRSTFAAGAAAYYVNIKTDYRAVGDGVTDDATAFTNFNTWAKAQTRPIYLVLPAGKYHTTGSGNFTNGVKKLTVAGYGATVDNILIGTGIQQNNTKSALVNDVTAGTAKITLKTPSEYTRFTVGGWVAITAYDMQGYGYPPNPYYFEYRKVNSINSSTGAIVLDKPLLNSYSSTYPLWYAGSPSAASEGGPATLYAMHPDWDREVTFLGLTFNCPFVFGAARSVTYEDCNFLTSSPSPSGGVEVAHINCTCDGTSLTEVDKSVSLLRYDTLTQKTLKIQSASIENCIISNSRLFQLTGTAKHQVIENTEITGEFKLGPVGYGTTESLVMNGCKVGTLAWQFAGTNWPATSYARGTFTASRSTWLDDHLNGIAPGQTYLIVTTSGRLALPFKITNVRDDGTNIYVDTTLPATINVPQIDVGGGVRGWSFIAHPCPSATVTDSTGCQDVLNMSNAPKGKPFGSYALYHLTGNFRDTTPTSFIVGNLVKMRVNVIRPYTGTLGSLILKMDQFGFDSLTNANGSSFSNWDPQINVKIAGERVITPGRTTGAQSGDANITINGVWITRSMRPYMGPGNPSDIGSENETVWPIVDVEIITDQGIVAVESVSSKTCRVCKY